MLPRVLETEVMDTAAEAADYDSMDHGEVNRRFVDDLLTWVPSATPDSSPTRILDVGTGTAQIPIELASRSLSVKITAVDLAAHMLQLAQRNVIAAGLGSAVRLEHVDAKGLPFADASFDVVMSNSIVHHIPEPLDALCEMRRVLRPGGLLFVRDLLRPPDEATLAHLVTTYAGDANSHQRQMFADSLHAALTLEEIRSLLAALSLPVDWVRQTTDRHWTIAGRLDPTA